MGSGFKIQHQTQAEKDRYLIECFQDSGFIKILVENDYSILAGRKGAGKTAIGRYLEVKYAEFDLLHSARISITSFSAERFTSTRASVSDKILLFILLKTAKHLLDKNYIGSTSLAFWLAVFKQEHIDSTTLYENFQTVKTTNKIGFSTLLSGGIEEERILNDIEVTTESIFNALLDSLPEIGPQTSFLYLVDDLSDYLDDSKTESIRSEIEVISDVLFRLDHFNTEFQLHEKGLRFTACIRDDLFEFMEGSNVNKLKSNSLFLAWNEESFTKLLIRRLPHFENKQEEALSHPTESIKELFPDFLFSNLLKRFETNRYATNFYAYMVAISFNRPRDFLAYCYALRDRLSFKHPVTTANINAAETEYSDYFRNEIKDELYLASRILSFDSNGEFINKLIDLLAERDDFNSNQLRTGLAPLLSVKTRIGRKTIERFIFQLWWYGIIGFKEKKEDKLVRFKYINATLQLLPDKVDKLIYYLHSGLWWFAKKRKAN